MAKLSQIGRLAFKVFLLSMYTAFFAVQLCLRFASPHTDITYSSFIRQLQKSDGTAKDRAVTKIDTRHQKTTWLNKRYSPEPQLAVNAAAGIPDVPYFILRNQYATYRQIVINRLLLHSSLRAPPAMG